MLVTIDEAELMLCPQGMASDRYINCVGNRCMAWKWAIALKENEQQKDVKGSEYGYCGLAGKVID